MKAENIDLRIAIDGYVEHCVVEKAQDKRRENLYGQLSELEVKAAKWDMIQSAIENEVMFVDTHNDSINGHQTLTTEDMEYLEKLHKERDKL